MSECNTTEISCPTDDGGATIAFMLLLSSLVWDTVLILTVVSFWGCCCACPILCARIGSSCNCWNHGPRSFWHKVYPLITSVSAGLLTFVPNLHSDAESCFLHWCLSLVNLGHLVPPGKGSNSLGIWVVIVGVFSSLVVSAQIFDRNILIAGILKDSHWLTKTWGSSSHRPAHVSDIKVWQKLSKLRPIVLRANCPLVKVNTVDSLNIGSKLDMPLFSKLKASIGLHADSTMLNTTFLSETATFVAEVRESCKTDMVIQMAKSLSTNISLMKSLLEEMTIKDSDLAKKWSRVLCALEKLTSNSPVENEHKKCIVMKEFAKARLGGILSCCILDPIHLEYIAAEVNTLLKRLKRNKATLISIRTLGLQLIQYTHPFSSFPMKKDIYLSLASFSQQHWMNLKTVRDCSHDGLPTDELAFVTFVKETCASMTLYDPCDELFETVIGKILQRMIAHEVPLLQLVAEEDELRNFLNNCSHVGDTIWVTQFGENAAWQTFLKTLSKTRLANMVRFVTRTEAASFNFLGKFVVSRFRLVLCNHETVLKRLTALNAVWNLVDDLLQSYSDHLTDLMKSTDIARFLCSDRIPEEFRKRHSEIISSSPL